MTTDRPFEPGDVATTLFEELLNWHQDEILSDSESNDLSVRLLAVIDRYRPVPNPVVAVLARETARWHALWDTISEALFDKAEGFTCVEANAITAHARWLGETQFAQAFIESHAAGDEPGDLHYTA